MKMKQLVTTAAILVAIALAAPSAKAITAAQTKEVKKAVTSVPIPEMPAKAAELVLKASKADRADVAAAAVRAAIYKSRSSAPQVVAAVSKAAPEVAGVASMTAVQMEGDQASLIAQAATTAAPGAKTEIASSVRSGLMTSSGMTVASSGLSYTSGGGGGFTSSSGGGLSSRGSFDGPGTGNVFNSKRPINQNNGGDGNGNFPHNPPNDAGNGHEVDYTKPRKI